MGSGDRRSHRSKHKKHHSKVQSPSLPHPEKPDRIASAMVENSGKSPDNHHVPKGEYEHPYWYVCRRYSSSYYDYEHFTPTFNRDTKDYELLQKVGRGKYSEVFRARHKVSGSLCVLKVLKPIIPRKIQREIMILTMLCGGPNIVRLLDVLKYPGTGTPVLVTECVQDATNLRKLINSRRLSDFDLRYYIYEILRALDFAHRHGIFHRDIKPQNVMIDHERRIVRIIDWGLAEFYVHGQSLNCRVATKYYKGPELLLDNRMYDYSLDIWCLGCMLAGLLFRKDPLFKRNQVEEQLLLVLELFGTDIAKKYVKKYGGKIPSAVKEEFDSLPTQQLSWEEFVPKSQWSSHCCPLALDLISKMLQFDHQDRPTAEECMQHPYFAPVVQDLQQSLDEQYPRSFTRR